MHAVSSISPQQGLGFELLTCNYNVLCKLAIDFLQEISDFEKKTLTFLQEIKRWNNIKNP